MGNPVEWANVLDLPDMGGTVQLRPHGVAEAGKIYPAWDGDRFYHCNAYTDCVYILVKAKKDISDRRARSSPRIGLRSQPTSARDTYRR